MLLCITQITQLLQLLPCFIKLFQIKIIQLLWKVQFKSSVSCYGSSTLFCTCLLNLRFLLQFPIFLVIYFNLLSGSNLIVILSNWICFAEVNHSIKIENINLSRSQCKSQQQKRLNLKQCTKLESQTLAWLWLSRGRLIVINKSWHTLNIIELTYRKYQPTMFLSEKDIERVFEHYIYGYIFLRFP